jgi:hypothetical protein
MARRTVALRRIACVRIIRSTGSFIRTIFLVCAFLALPGLSHAQAFNLGVRVDINTGYVPPSVAIADLNGDGKLDIVAGNNGGLNGVSVLLGTGGGAFGAVNQYPTGTSPWGVAVADVNGDGKPDILVANSGAGTISILPGNGAGSFGARTDLPVGFSPNAIAVGDLNGDGIPDLAVTNGGSNSVSVLLGNGVGGFSRTDFTTGAQPVSAAIADINGDGKQDLVVANRSANTVSVLLGNGAGGFGAKTDYPTATTPRFVTTGDLNGDGRPDVAVATFQDIITGDVSVLLNTGGGALGPKTDYSLGDGATSVAIADLNGDGIPDLAAALGGSVQVLPGTGGGAFGAGLGFGVGQEPFWVVVGDLNGDGRPDIVTANFNTQGITILFGGGNAFTSELEYSTGSNPFALAMGDVNADGKKDLAVANESANTVSILLGNGSGGLGFPTNFTTGATPYAIALADVSNDGKTDLIVANNGANTMSVLLGSGTGGFGAKTDFATGTAPSGLAIGDMNADGKPDAVVANYGANSVSVLLGNGTGGFGAKTDFATGVNPQSLALVDVSGDGKLDVVTPNFTPSTVSVLLGNGTGGLGAKTDFATGTNPFAVAVGDLSGDGKPDIVTANLNATTISVLLGTGGGAFGAKTDYATLTNPASVSIADFNGDGRLDVEVGYVGAADVSVFYGNGAGGLGTRADYVTGGGAYGSIAGDLNADGRPDIVSAEFGLSRVSVLLGLEPTRLALSTNPAFAVPGASYLYTATMSVPAPGSGSPSGTVSFFDGVRYLGTAPLNSGVAMLSTFNPQLVSHSISATYSGDTKFLPAIGQVNMSTALAPHIASIHDVPNDQGGHVELRWDASPLDRAPADPISQYKIWRQLPNGFAVQSLANGSRHLADPARGTPLEGELRATRFGTQTFYWEYLATQIAGGYPGYSLAAATAADSVGGSNPRTGFMVEADEPFDGLTWASAPDSGYSTDNLPPAAVTPFTGTYSAGTASLHWGTSSAPDFADYLIYRGSTANFVPGPGNLVVSQPDTGYADHTPLQFYKLAAKDVHGNIGPYTLLQLSAPLSVSEGGSYAFALEGARPNPVVGRSLSVYFTLPSAERAELELIDVAGRRVLEREVGSLGAGPHAVDLARDRALPSGLYLVRLTQGANVRITRAAVLN